MKIIKGLKIEKIINKGFGLGFYESDPILVPFSLPGDILDVRIDYRKKKVIFGSIVNIVHSSDIRKEPDCEVFGTCGGCDWLNLDYPDQCRIKEDLISDIFRKFNTEIELVRSPQSEFYRNKAYYPVSEQNGEVICGMFARGSHRVIPHKKCLLHPEVFDNIAEVVYSYIEKSNEKPYEEKSHSGNIRHIGFRYSFSRDEILVIIVTRRRKLAFTKQLVRMLCAEFSNLIGIVQNINPQRTNSILGEEEKILFGKAHFYERIENWDFKIGYKSFFQVNNFISPLLFDYVKSRIEKNSFVIDAYSGVGTIGIMLSDVSQKIFCLENNPVSCLNAEENFAVNKITNIENICGDINENIEKICSQHKIDSIIFDPPRKGIDKRVLTMVIRNRIPQVIYISCNPMSQLRDVNILLENGYKIHNIKAFDMFPQTYHIENVVTLHL